MTLPNSLPRPPDELERLEQAWLPPKGWRFISAVNNNYLGVFYIGTSILFFILAGILALIMRTQLAVPDNDLVSHNTYNQLFTMHGTVMMFLFAVPVAEAMAVYLLPNMLAARDLPFPRLSAYAFWAYAIGGIVFFGSIFWDLAPKGGWFMYPPLTSYEYSPGINSDFWLLGIGFIEISAIAGAIEIVVGILKTRPPGMSLDKMPLYAWAMLVFAGMIIFAFPAVILATALLELERAFQWPFFVAEQGGDPLLWQHLFWIFGHPEVYIIFLPAAGMVSMMIPTLTRTPLIGHRYIVLALVGTGFLSFGLWVHHMFTTGIPQPSLSYFSAASMAVAIPSGIQIFAWIATFAAGRLQMNVPTLFLLGFLFIFVLGGLTGVMVAVVPFDWQVHDSYFIVAHLHYVLIGGMLFPLFAAFYFWIPSVSAKPLSERLGRWVFGLMFIGFNLTFFPMHLAGLLGMPRRVYTYPAGYGLELPNLLSTLGAYILAAGVLLFMIDLIRKLRPFRGESAGNVWNAGTLEWLPNGNYNTRSIPYVSSLYPLWQQPNLAEDVKAGRYYLPGTVTGGRETIVTTPVDATPQYVGQIPGPGWPALLAAVGTAGFFLLLTVKLVIPALFFGGLAVVMTWRWLWDTDPGPSHPPVDIGGGLRLPVYATGTASHSWWAMLVLILVAASTFGCLLFSYFYLWTVSPEVWPDRAEGLPDLDILLIKMGLIAGSSGVILLTDWKLKGSPQMQPRRFQAGLLLAILLAAAAFILELQGHLQSGLRPSDHSYGAAVYLITSFQGFYMVVVSIMALYCVARAQAGLINRERRVSFENTAMFWHYSMIQTLVGMAVVHLFPRLLV